MSHQLPPCPFHAPAEPSPGDAFDQYDRLLWSIPACRRAAHAEAHDHYDAREAVGAFDGLAPEV